MSDVKALGLTQEVHLQLSASSRGEGGGIPGEEETFVDIRRNTGGVGDFLAPYCRWDAGAGAASRIYYPGIESCSPPTLSHLRVSFRPESRLRHRCSCAYLPISPLHAQFHFPLPYSRPAVSSAGAWLSLKLSHLSFIPTYVPFTPSDSG